MVLKALYAGNALWHTSAFWHFCFRQTLMMRVLARRKKDVDPNIRSLPQGDKWHHDIMAYLGGMNTPLALLALLRLIALLQPSNRLLSTGSSSGDVQLDIVALLVLGLANCSQAVLNFTMSRQSGRWIMGRGLDRITVLDTFFTICDWLAVWAMSGSVA